MTIITTTYIEKIKMKICEKISKFIALTLITVVFLFSYLHSQRGQNICSFPFILLAYIGRITESQSLKKKIRKIVTGS